MNKDSFMAMSLAVVLIAILMTGLIVFMQITLNGDNSTVNKGLCICPKEKK